MKTKKISPLNEVTRIDSGACSYLLVRHKYKQKMENDFKKMNPGKSQSSSGTLT